MNFLAFLAASLISADGDSTGSRSQRPRDKVVFIDTPNPLSKRAKRRARRKVKRMRVIAEWTNG